VADALGPKPVIALGWLLYAAVYAGFAVATSAVHIWILFAVYGLFFGLTEAPEKALVARLAPVHARGRAFGIFHAAVGFAALPSSLIFGMVWQVWGAANAFYMGACLALAAAVSLPSFVRETALTPSGLR
jgi:sugar phosphate permease